MEFKPLLSAKLDAEDDGVLMSQLQKLSYPMIASPKVDGIRVLVHPDLGPVTRKLKRVPNEHIFSLLNRPEFYGLDGEIVLGDNPVSESLFNDTQSSVMTFSGEPDFTFWVFDDFTFSNMLYQTRYDGARSRAINAACKYVSALSSHGVKNPDEILFLEAEYLKQGYEGIMLRSLTAPYKFGRSTLKQQHLIKLKRRADAEAKVVGFTPLYHNINAPTKDALGHQTRSSHKAGQSVDNDRLGALVCEPLPESGFTQQFEIGSGFDDATRRTIWQDQNLYLGRIVSYKYQAVGVKDKPRFPIFKGFRED